jgi:hypothetical protein
MPSMPPWYFFYHKATEFVTEIHGGEIFFARSEVKAGRGKELAE